MFEKEDLQSCPEEIRPSTWLRYMDDVVEEFTAHLNSRNPGIKLTELQDEEQDHQHLPVLDIDINRQDDGSSKFKIYKKTKTLTNTWIGKATTLSIRN